VHGCQNACPIDDFIAAVRNPPKTYPAARYNCLGFQCTRAQVLKMTGAPRQNAKASRATTSTLTACYNKPAIALCLTHSKDTAGGSRNGVSFSVGPGGSVTDVLSNGLVSKPGISVTFGGCVFACTAASFGTGGFSTSSGGGFGIGPSASIDISLPDCQPWQTVCSPTSVDNAFTTAGRMVGGAGSAVVNGAKDLGNVVTSCFGLC
jgi:hypothetical protein